jgi:hypothetical protein
VKIYLPAWHYRARAIVQRTWGWSPIEEMILLALDRTPGTIEDVARSLGTPYGQKIESGLAFTMSSSSEYLTSTLMAVSAGAALPAQAARGGRTNARLPLRAISMRRPPGVAFSTEMTVPSRPPRLGIWAI